MCDCNILLVLYICFLVCLYTELNMNSLYVKLLGMNVICKLKQKVLRNYINYSCFNRTVPVVNHERYS
jgi:hypothetical protein